MSQLANIEVADPHDSFFRQLLADPVIAVDFVQNYLPAAVVELLDLTNLRIEKESFVDARLRKHYSDVLYSVPLKSSAPAEDVQRLAASEPKPSKKQRKHKSTVPAEECIYLYLLFEHKSQPDEGVRLQLLRYMVRIWEKEWRKRKKLSPILPVVFYHGVEQWSYSHEFADLLPNSALFQLHTPHIQHLLIDLSAYSDEEIRGEIWLQVCLLMMKHIYDEDVGKRLPQIVSLLQKLAGQENVMEMLQTVLVYATAASNVVNEEDIRRSVRAVISPERSELMEKTLAQKWMEQGREQGREQGIEQGREQGIEQGIEQGKVIAQRQTLLRLLQWRFALTEQEKRRYSNHLAKIDRLDHLTQLLDRLLITPTAAEFENVLQRYLPPEEAQK